MGHRTRGAGGRPHQGDARQRRLEDGGVQGAELPNAGGPRGGWLPAPAAQGAGGVPEDPHGHGVRRDAHQQVGGGLLLELRRAFSAAEPPRPRRPRHLLHQGAGVHELGAGGLLRAGAGGAREGRLRLRRLRLQLQARGGDEEHPAHAHHSGLEPDAVQDGSGVPGGGQVHAQKVLFYRPCLPQRKHGRHPSLRVPPGRGSGGRPEPVAGQPHWGDQDLLCADWHHKFALQACLQPVHRAEHGDLRLSPGPEVLDRDRKLWHVPTRDAAADGAARRRARHCLGPEFGAAHYDQVQCDQHPRPFRPQGRPWPHQDGAHLSFLRPLPLTLPGQMETVLSCIICSIITNIIAF
mmetsp:Transcript_22505/g.36016  ORF Transcript_22505/g.36016 Transcript_22505/m.36016 type:complete len:350 (-) Transcript_22505:210-1259(-)